MKLKKPKPPTIFQQPPVVLNEYKPVDEQKLAQCVDILDNAKMDMQRIARLRKLRELSQTIRNT